MPAGQNNTIAVVGLDVTALVPGGHAGATLQSSAADLNPEIDTSESHFPDPPHPRHLLVDRAREHGAVRADVTGTDVILLMCAPNYVTSYVPDAPSDLWRRYLAIIFDGLRPEGAHPLPHPPPAVP